MNHFIHFQWLCQMIVHSGILHCLYILYKCIGSHGYDWNCLRVLTCKCTNLLGCLDTIHHRHHHIHENHIIGSHRCILKLTNCCIAIHNRCYLCTRIGKQVFCNIQIQFIIFYKQDLDIIQRYLLLIFILIVCDLRFRGNLKWNGNCKCRTDTNFTPYLDLSVHAVGIPSPVP